MKCSKTSVVEGQGVASWHLSTVVPLVTPIYPLMLSSGVISPGSPPAPQDEHPGSIAGVSSMIYVPGPQHPLPASHAGEGLGTVGRAVPSGSPSRHSPLRPEAPGRQGSVHLTRCGFAVFLGSRCGWTRSGIQSTAVREGGGRGGPEDLLHGHRVRTGGREENWKLIVVSSEGGRKEGRFKTVTP